MDIIASTARDILQSMVRVLDAKISSQETPENIFISADETTPPYPNPGTRWLSVSPGGALVDPEVFVGGGKRTIWLTGTYIVNVNCVLRIDQRGRDEEWFMNEEYGVYELGGDVIGALAEEQLLNENDEPIVVDPIQPRGFDPPQRTGSEPAYGRVPIVFEIRHKLKIKDKFLQ